MDDAFYSELAEGAAELIEQFGQPCVLSRENTGGGVYDPNTGTTSDVPDLEQASDCVKLDYETKDIDGTNIKASDVRFLIAFTVVVEPKSGDIITLTRNGSKWQVVRCKPLDPGGYAVLYDVQARQ